MFYFVIFLVPFMLKSVTSISNTNSSGDFTNTLWELSNLVVQGRQYRPYSPEYTPTAEKYPSYYQHYKPQKAQYGYPQNYPSDFQLNEIHHSPYVYRPPAYPSYPSRPIKPTAPFFQKTQQSVMEALFSIAQNDDLQCVPKLLCEITSGGLTGRQGGFQLPVNLNLDSLTTFLSGLNSENMSPVLHFGKAALLGLTSKGHTRSCQYSYPQCPSDPGRLIQYLNNHNGGFFRFFQGVKPTGHHDLQNYAPQYFNGYRPGFSGKALAEKRIQNQPSTFVNNHFDKENYYKEHKGIGFPQYSYTTPIQKIIFPSLKEQSSNYFVSPPVKTLKFPVEHNSNVPVRHGKTLYFNQYPTQTNDNFLDIQRPLPNHIPAKNIFPDRTGTGQLNLDLEDFEDNYQQSVAYDHGYYNQLLYDSFPNDGGTRNRQSYLSFPNE